MQTPRPAASPSSAATGSRSPAPTPPTPTPPTRRCSPPRSTGWSTRFGLEGERLGEVVAGAVLKHSRDFNLTRESVLGSKLSPETPATDIQQACGTGLQAAIQVANKIALGQIDVGIAGGTDTTSDAPVAISDKLRKKLMKVNAARDTAGPAQGARRDPARRHRPRDPAERRAAHRAVDGRARRADRARVADRPRGAGRARRGVAPAPRRGVRRRASSTTRSRRSAASSATTTCAPTRRSRSWRSSSRSSARARPRR